MEVDRNGLRILPPEECLARLGRGGIGRVAVTIGALPAIFPVNYAVMGRDVVFMTTPGTKLSAAAHDAVVAFEVDEIDRINHDGWSVMVIGRSEEISDAAERKLAAALPLARWAQGTGPGTYVRIRSEVLSGRALRPIRTIQAAG